MKYSAIISGLAGSIALTILHETLRKNVANAPRMDLMGEEGVEKILVAANMKVPSEPTLFNMTMAGDIVGNAIYYANVGLQPKNSIMNGAVLGLTAGIGALTLPDKLGLNKEYSNATRKTQVLTVAIYFVGGLVAGIVNQSLRRKK